MKRSKIFVEMRFFVAVAILCATMGALQAAQTPNVIMLFIDDLGMGDIGPFGCEDIPTPHIDRLASEGGVQFVLKESGKPFYVTGFNYIRLRSTTW